MIIPPRVIHDRKPERNGLWWDEMDVVIMPGIKTAHQYHNPPTILPISTGRNIPPRALHWGQNIARLVTYPKRHTVQKLIRINVWSKTTAQMELSFRALIRIYHQ